MSLQFNQCSFYSLLRASVQKVASSVSIIKVFYANLSAFLKFCLQRECRFQMYLATSQRVTRGCATRWNFRRRTVNIIFEMKDTLEECLSSIINELVWDTASISEANSLKIQSFFSFSQQRFSFLFLLGFSPTRNDSLLFFNPEIHASFLSLTRYDSVLEIHPLSQG